MLAFAQPWFLLGFIALTLPILAHLIQARQTQTQTFPSVRFIKASKIPQSSERRLSDIFLLLLRLLIISSITLALAGTYWQTEGDQKSQQETIILIDNSASMSATNKQQQLHQHFETILDTLQGSVGLIIFGKNIQQTIKPQNVKTTVLSVFNNLNTSLDQGHPQDAINAALNLFSQDIQKKTLVIISDFQTSNWQNVSAKLNQVGISLILERLASYNDNTSILQAIVSPLSVESLRISVQLYNDSNHTKNKTLKLDAGKQSWQQDLVLEPKKNQQAFFEIPRYQFDQAELSFTEKDEYPADDQYFLWLKEPPAVASAVLSTPFNSNDAQKEAYFVRTALQSHSAYDWQHFALSPFQFLDNSILNQNLSLWQSAFIFIAGLPGDIDPALLKQFRRYMEQGGTLMATPGYSVAQSLEKLTTAEILNARYLSTQRQESHNSEPFRISHINTNSAIKQLFKDEAETDLKLTRIYKYIDLKLEEGVDVLMEVDDGKALLIKKAIGKGQFIYSSLKFHLAWTDLPLGNSFLPLIRELLSTNSQSVSWPALSIGETFNNRQTENFNSSSGFTAEKIGLFNHNNHFISVNVSRQESHRKQLSNTQLIENLSGSNPSSVNQDGTNSGTSNIDTSNQHTIRLWPWLILLACLLFVSESILARTKPLPATEDI